MENKRNLYRAMTSDGSARITVLNSVDMINEMVKVHATAPTATAAMGRLITATSMMGSLLGNKEDSITVGFNGNGEAGKILAVSDYYGNVKGYIENPLADPPRRSDGHLNVAMAVGEGNMFVVRDIAGTPPQSGMVEIKTGEIAEDIAAYFAESEQVPTLCALGVLARPDGSCKSAGGVLIQLLPFADESTVDLIERNASELVNISSLFDKGLTNEEIASIALKDIPYDPFDEIFVEYTCDCSRDRMHRGIAGLGNEEITRLFDEQEAEGKPRELEAVCRFCHKAYKFTEEDF